MRIKLDEEYDQMKICAGAFGFVGPVLYATFGGTFNICIFTNGGANAITGAFAVKPATFDADFPHALNVIFQQLTM